VLMAEAGSEAPLVRVERLSRHFDLTPSLLNRLLQGQGRRVLKAVDDISFAIGRGETLALVGESGCGKSTIARCLVGLYPPTRGRIVFDDIDTGRLRSRAARRPLHRRVQMIFQDPFASLNPRWRVADIVAEPIRAHRLAPAHEVRPRVEALLEEVGLSGSDGERFPHQFSGGQRQRISIARALASRPEFLVCDEPTSALDVSVQAQILNLMKDLQSEFGLTYLFISHDLAVVHHMADRVGVMYLGRICEMSDTDSLFARPRHPYTRLLLDTIPTLEAREREREPVAGEVPSPIDPPPGCAFHPRCPHANERCRRERPELKSVEGGLVACHGQEERRIPAYDTARPAAGAERKAVGSGAS